MSYCKTAAKFGDEYVKFYPGVYSEEDKALIDSAVAARVKLNARGPVKVSELVNQTLPEDTPGISQPRGHHGPPGEEGPKDAPKPKAGDPTVVTAESIKRTGMQKGWENPIWWDDEYAQKLGYKSALMYPLGMTIAGSWGDAMPTPLRDTLAVSGLNRIHYFSKPVYAGDKLYSIENKQDLTEITPYVDGGCEYRTFRMYGEGQVYNQDGELVGESIGFVKESLKKYVQLPEGYDGRTFDDSWDCANWWERKTHQYTDEDWEFIKDQWSKEKRRGEEPLYWDDVKEGEYIPPKYVGPMTAFDLGGRFQFYNGDAYNLTIKEKLADPEISKTMYKNQYGIWVDKEADVLNAPGGPEFTFIDRSIFENSTCAAFAIDMLFNWMGDRGWMYKIAWDIMGVFPGYEGLIPDHPDEPMYIQQVPGFENYRPFSHGLAGDMCVCKAWVKSKYVKNGEYFVDLVWWCETFDGYVFEEGEFTVILPKK